MNVSARITESYEADSKKVEGLGLCPTAVIHLGLSTVWTVVHQFAQN